MMRNLRYYFLRRFFIIFLTILFLPGFAFSDLDSFVGIRQEFVERHCYECHDSEMEEGGLNLERVEFNLESSYDFDTWVKIHDRVKSGEMPPKERLPAGVATHFTGLLGKALETADRARVRQEGRALIRRLNRHEYENTLRDILKAPWLQVADMLPEDGTLHGFNKSGESLDVSHVHMHRYLEAAEYALRAVMIDDLERPQKTEKRYYASEQKRFVGPMNQAGPVMRRPFPVLGTGADHRFPEMYETLNTRRGGSARKAKYEGRSREMLEEEGIGMITSTYEPAEIQFDSFVAPQTGRYRLRMKGHSIWVGAYSRWIEPGDRQFGKGVTERIYRMFPRFDQISPSNRSEPVTLYADRKPRILRKLASFDVYPEPSVEEIEVILMKGETIRPDAARLFRPRSTLVINPNAEENRMPGVVFRWLEVEGPLLEEWPSAGHKVLFADLPLVRRESGVVEVVSSMPEKDAERLIRRFLERCYVGPVEEEDVQLFVCLFSESFEQGDSFTESMLFAYKAILCSPRFLYREQKHGELDDWSLASRLSYFLWNSPPDEDLLQLAFDGELRKSDVLRGQVERLLSHFKSERFIKAFLDYWLDLRGIADTSPDGSLYPEYQLDDLLVESMIEESRAFFQVLLEENFGVINIINSDFVVINERLADHYGIDHVSGVKVRRVNLLADNVRGGIMTQASVLKVTADGNNTSPVRRGVWVMERLLGEHVSPPPENVPAVEPDTRGATTIRELLAKHKNDKSCASCHKKIDPYGFALEGFDVMGGVQEFYRAVGGNPIDGGGHNGRPFEFHYAQGTETHGKLSDGALFQDVRELKRLLGRDERKIAKGILEQLIVYATGAPVRFSDRKEITRILDRANADGYGIRTLIHEFVQSSLFRNK